MRILILGGTSFVGRTVALTAVRRGHDVTCAARAVSGAPPAGAEFVRVDRDEEYGLAQVAGRRWDAVVDVARQPDHVMRAVQDLAPVTTRYVFVSTVGVYAGWPGGDCDEAAPLKDPFDGAVWTPADYERGKVSCESAVLDAFGQARALVVRPALIGGPGDLTGRSGYWPWRFAHPTGRQVLVPDAPSQGCQILDGRDLADWLLLMVEQQATGVFNAAGVQTTLQKVLGMSRRVAAGDAAPLPVATDSLVAHGVSPWMGPRSLPLWLGDDQLGAVTPSEKAVEAGLHRRPLRATLADALAYENTLPEAKPHGAGLTDEEESELIAAFSGAPASTP